jgi:DNA-binding HxlR family transcriptional regulator
MVLLDLLGRRQALRILWELGSTAPLTFRELQARCDNISPTVLNNRIKELREAMIIERAPDSGYVLTELGLDEAARAYQRLVEEVGKALPLSLASPNTGVPASCSMRSALLKHAIIK